jgi:glutathione S-transferase
MLAAVEIPFTHQIPFFPIEEHFLSKPIHLKTLREKNCLVAGQVPLLMVKDLNGEQCYVQSMATVRMLARRYAPAMCMGRNEEERTDIDIAAEIVLDWRNSTGGSWEFGMGGFKPNDVQRQRIQKGNQKYAPILEKMLKRTTSLTPWLAASYEWSYADILFLEVMSNMEDGGHLLLDFGDLDSQKKKKMNRNQKNDVYYPNVLKLYLRLKEKMSVYLNSDLRMTKTNQQEVIEYIRMVNQTFGR